MQWKADHYKHSPAVESYKAYKHYMAEAETILNKFNELVFDE